MNTPKTFCVLPWMHRFTNVGGEVEICCTAEEHFPEILGDDGKPLHISTIKDDKEVMNSKFMKQLRLKMLAGEWSPQCERCEVTEKVGAISRRQNENINYADLVEELIKNTAPDGEIPVKVVSSDFRVGNLCNLTCRMCNPRSSIPWIKEYSMLNPKHMQITFTSHLIERVKKYDWYKDEGVIEQLKAQLPYLRHLHFAGGEPLVVPEMVRFLQVCVDSGHSENVELTYNTNITKVPAEVKKLWPHFKAVKLFCSVDGFDEVNSLIRYPARWQDIDKNLRDIEENHEKYGIKEVIIMCTLQVYNVLRLKDLYDYLAENFKFVTQVPQLIDLHFPFYFSTQILPPQLKEQALSSMKEIELKTLARIESGLIPKNQERYLESLRGGMNFLMADDRQKLIPNFIIATSSFDKRRNENTFKVIPEFMDLLGHADLFKEKAQSETPN